MICFFLLMVSILVDDGSASWVKVTNSPVVLQSEIIINYKIDNFNPARYIIIIILTIMISIIFTQVQWYSQSPVLWDWAHLCCSCLGWGGSDPCPMWSGDLGWWSQGHSLLHQWHHHRQHQCQGDLAQPRSLSPSPTGDIHCRCWCQSQLDQQCLLSPGQVPWPQWPHDAESGSAQCSAPAGEVWHRSGGIISINKFHINF